MKTCRICNEAKSIDSFHRRGNGRRTECKPCKSLIDSGRRRRLCDNFYSVYYLPEHHYVGMTNSMKHRMQEHKCKGKFIDNYEVVGSYSTAVEAHLTETMLHAMGYNGFYYKGQFLYSFGYVYLGQF